MPSLLFVCTANICRSPMAEAALRQMLADRGIAPQFEIDSAGTHDYLVGRPPDPIAVSVAGRRGYAITRPAARRIAPGDFERFDHILAMDRMNLLHLRRIAPTRCGKSIELVSEYAARYGGREVPDPFGKDAKAFELAMDIIEDACRGLAELIGGSPPLRP